MSYRTESDSLGQVHIPKDKLWGPQSQRSLENFKIGQDIMPLELIQALALIKECAAQANVEQGLLNNKKARWIIKAAQEIQEGLKAPWIKKSDLIKKTAQKIEWERQFPLTVWQTGSGTQSHMNVNEVIANRAIQLSGGRIGDKSLHPNDDVNKCQSSNDIIPSAMRIALYVFIQQNLIPALKLWEKTLQEKTKQFEKIIKIGRTHLMDAVPLSLGQEFSAFYQQIASNRERLEKDLPRLLSLPLGGTAVGTGLNSFPEFGKKVCALISKKTSYKWESAKNKFSALSNHDSLVSLSGSLKTLAISLIKITNDIRLLASGPRAGLGELILPANEPGSSIMPGKINPSQCEALSMLCAQVIGQDLSVSLGGMGGHLQLNTFKPLIFFNSLRSARLLSDGLNNFKQKALSGLKANEKKIKQNLENSLMLITALNPHIGYDKAAKIAQSAYKNGRSLKEEAIKLGFLNAKEFDRLVCPKKMIKPNLIRPKKS